MNIYVCFTFIMFFFIITTHSHYGRMIVAGNNRISAIGKPIRTNDQYQKIAVILSGILLIVITGLRSPKISEDYQHYEYIFNHVIRNISWREVILDREPLFRLLMKIIGEFTDYNIVIFMLIISAITCFFLFRFIYNEATYPIFILFLLFTIGSYFTSFNTTRQYLAVALYTIAFQYACKRNRKRYVVTVIIITFFHFSALAMLPFYWLLNLSWKKAKDIRINLIVLFLLFIFFFRVKYMINGLIGIYYFNLDGNIQGLYESTISPLNVIRPAIIFVIAFLFRKKLNRENAEDNCLFNSSIYFLVFYLYAYQVTLFIRFTYFFIPGSLILIDRLLDRIKPSNRVIVFDFFIVFSIVWCAMGMFNNEYLFFWQ